MKNGKKNKGKKAYTDFVRHILLANKNILCFHEENFFENLQMMVFHVSPCLRLAPIWMPRYMNDKDNNLQFNKSTYLSIVFPSTSITPNILLKKFTWSPNASSKHHMILLNKTFLKVSSPIKVVQSAYYGKFTITFCFSNKRT